MQKKTFLFFTTWLLCKMNSLMKKPFFYKEQQFKVIRMPNSKQFLMDTLYCIFYQSIVNVLANNYVENNALCCSLCRMFKRNPLRMSPQKESPYIQQAADFRAALQVLEQGFCNLHLLWCKSNSALKLICPTLSKRLQFNPLVSGYPPRLSSYLQSALILRSAH